MSVSCGCSLNCVELQAITGHLGCGRALSPLGGGVETAEHTSEADEQQPAVAGEDKVAQHDHDDAQNEQGEHEHGHPLRADLRRFRHGWRVARRCAGAGAGVLVATLWGYTTAGLALRRSHDGAV